MAILLFIGSCSGKPSEPPARTNQIMATLPTEWDYQTMFSIPELKLPLPEDTEISSSGKGDTLVQYHFYTDRGQETGTGFAMVLAKDNWDFPPGKLYDSICKSESTYTVISTEKYLDFELIKIQTDCGGLMKFLIKKKGLLIRIHPANQSGRVLKIVEQIVSNAKFAE